MAVNGIVGANYLLSRIGNSYEKEDCVHAVVINLIRNCEGGDPSYRTAGCTELWNSYTKYNPNNKYRHIVSCKTIDQARKDGLLIGDLPVIYDSDSGKCEHIAYYMGGIGGYECIHSSASRGCVCGTTLKNGFTHVLRHRDIEGVTNDQNDQNEMIESIDEVKDMDVLYYVSVSTNGGALNLRSAPKIGNNILCEIPFGTKMAVLKETSSEWLYVQYDNVTGYVSRSYTALLENTGDYDDEDDEPIMKESTSLFSRGTWGVFIPCGSKGNANSLSKHLNASRVIKLAFND